MEWDVQRNSKSDRQSKLSSMAGKKLDQLKREARMFELAVIAFQDDAAAAGDFFALPNPLLKDRTPRAMCATMEGTREVEVLLSGFMYGDYA
jgi:uncharacterized protein (DUF2384 family)